MKRLLPLFLALSAVVLSFPRLDAQRPTFTTGTPAELALARSIGLERLELVGQQKGLEPNDLAVSRVEVDGLSMAHVRVQQRFRGIPVFGGQAISHLGSDGQPFAETDDLVPFVNVNPTPALTAATAIDIAVTDYGCRACLTETPTADLWILRDEAGRDHLVFRVQMRRIDGSAQTALPVRFVDAHGGSVVLAYDNLQTGTGASLYSGTVTIGTRFNPVFGDYAMENHSLRVGTFDMMNTTQFYWTFFDPDDVWDSFTQRAGVDAHFGMERYYSYLSAVHGRNGIDGFGGPFTIPGDDPAGTLLVSSLVHYGSGYNNAFWSGDLMVYGDGDGFTFSPLVSLDIAGHEMTHGVTQFTAGLIYNGESGALNESWSDVFGAMLERHIRGENADTWLIGEQVFTPGTPGDAIRYMHDPHLAPNFGFTADDDPDHYAERYTGTQDNGGVHFNSGIANKAFYLLAKGGSHHVGGSMTGIGADQAARIWFTALTSYMTSSTDFQGARNATTLAAAALHGSGSAQEQAVGMAWCLVGVGACATVQAISVTPASGSGMTQSFTLQYSDSLGAADLSAARVRVGTTNVDPGTCTVSYNATTGVVELLNDAGTASTAGTMGSGTLSNSQCTLNLAGSSAAPNGNNLTLVLDLTFSGSFTGLKNIYMLAQSGTVGGASTGWILRGTWNSLPVAAVSVTPNAGAGVTQTFTLQYLDALGASDLESARVRFGGSNEGPGTCTAKYNAMTGAIALLNDAATAWTAGVIGSGTIANSQCTLNLAGSSATPSGNSLTLALNVTFSGSFTGLKQIYMLAKSAGGASSGWQQRGTWTTNAPTGPNVGSVTPAAGSGITQAFLLQYSHSSGAANLTSVRVRFGAANVGPGTCTARYKPANGVVELLNDAGTAWAAGTLGTGTLSNSQCTLNLAGSAATPSGNDLSVLLPITFSASFAGQKTIFMLAASAGQSTGWQPRGTWTVLVPGPNATSVAPSVGAGVAQAFTLQYSDAAGAANLTSARVRFGASNVGPGTCTARYKPMAGTVELMNDAGTAWTPGTLGTGTLANSQCTLNLTGSSATVNGMSLTVVLDVTFNASFAGQKTIYMLATSSGSLSTGWQQRGTWTVPTPPLATGLFFDSQPGDWVGGGTRHLYTPADGTFTIRRNFNNGVSVSVIEPQYSFWWYLDFSATDNVPLQVGSYGNATRFAFADFVGMDVYGSGRGCGGLTGRFKVLEIAYDGSGNVQRFAVDFEQHCEDGDPALFGALRYDSTLTSPLEPFGGAYPSYKLRIAPPAFGNVSGSGIDCGNGGQTCEVVLSSPASLILTATPDPGYFFGGWSESCHGTRTTAVNVNSEKDCSALFIPFNSTQPATLLFWNSQQGDYIGQGVREVYAPGNSRWTFNPWNGGIGLQVNSVSGAMNSWWNLRFEAPTGQALAPGVYDNATRFSTPTTPAIDVGGNGRGCNATIGRFVVHELTVSAGVVTNLALDFEQHCENQTIPPRPLLGSIRYNSTVPPSVALAVTVVGHGRVTLSPPGTVCTYNCTETYAPGDSVQLIATPDPGRSFVSWTGDQDCLDGSLTMVAPTSCGATFQQLPVIPTLNGHGGVPGAGQSLEPGPQPQNRGP